MATGIIPPVDSSEYVHWRGQVDEFALRALIAGERDTCLHELRRRVSQLTSADVSRMDVQWLMQQATRLVQMGDILLVEGHFGVEFYTLRDAKFLPNSAPLRAGGGLRQKVEQQSPVEEPSKKPAETPKPDHWIEVQIRDEKTGAGIADAVLTIKAPDGHTYKAQTDALGIARVPDIPGGVGEIIDIRHADALEMCAAA